jgi:hypothetical protein
VNTDSRAGGVVATSNKVRPPAWCESILGDLMAPKDIDVVNDETTPATPRGQSAAPSAPLRGAML